MQILRNLRSIASLSLSRSLERLKLICKINNRENRWEREGEGERWNKGQQAFQSSYYYLGKPVGKALRAGGRVMGSEETSDGQSYFYNSIEKFHPDILGHFSHI